MKSFSKRGPVRLAAVWFFVAGMALNVTAQALPMDAQGLIRRAANNATKAAQDTSGLFMYRVKKETNAGVAVRDLIETKDLILARTITWNNRELTVEERAKEEQKLQTVLSNANAQQKKKEEQDADRRRTLSLVRALPDALIYTFDGSELVRGREAHRLRFRPNPDFDPPTKESYGLKAAAGRIWVDKEQEQIVRMEAALTENIYIGWGILGHISRGGTLELEQSLLAGNKWRITTLNVNATGKAFFFKTIRIKQRMTGWDFRPVPTNLTLTQAVEILRKPASLAVQKNMPVMR